LSCLMLSIFLSHVLWFVLVLDLSHDVSIRALSALPDVLSTLLSSILFLVLSFKASVFVLLCSFLSPIIRFFNSIHRYYLAYRLFRVKTVRLLCYYTRF
jgi:hypothetical protein